MRLPDDETSPYHDPGARVSPFGRPTPKAGRAVQPAREPFEAGRSLWGSVEVGAVILQTRFLRGSPN